MNKKSTSVPLRALINTLTVGSLLVAALNAQASVSQSPLSLTVGVPPNLVLSLDDSGSMNSSYVPDNAGGISNQARLRSAHFNPLHYNPATTYKAPPRFNDDGSPATTPYSSSFTAAPLYGFMPSQGIVNLSNSYIMSLSYSNHTASNNPAQNPHPDFYLDIVQSAPLSNGQTSAPITVNNVTFTIKRISNSSCEATITSANDYTTITCNRNSSGNYVIRSNDRRSTNVAAYYYVFDTTRPSCPALATAQRNNDNCYRRVYVSGATEQQNFANWYSFYRTRALATVSAASIVFAELPSSTRITWQGLTTCTELNSAASCLGRDNRFREFTQAQRGRLFTWLHHITFPNGTPLRLALDRAGKFLMTDAAWEKFPNELGNTPANTYSCRPSYHILMTDGVWNGADGTPAGTVLRDHANFNLPDGTNYNGTRTPYADPTSNTLADLAMHYWATDLRPGTGGAANQLKPYYADKTGTDSQNYWNARNNPATWQNMVNFTVGLGLTDSLTQAGLEWDANGTFGSPGYISLVNGTRTWPAAASNSTNNVYDLWHAAINSRGEFFSAESTESVVQAFADIMSRIADRKSVAAKPAINSGQIIEDAIKGTTVTTVSYQTSYASDDNWAGDLKRSEKELFFNSVTNKYEETFTEKWSAKDQLPAAGSRNIKIKSTTGSNLQDFTWANAGGVNTAGSLANLLSRDPENGNTPDTKGAARLDYLRGVRSGEGATGFRTRTTVLGDLYSSSPASVLQERYLASIANSIEGNTAYTTFKESVKTRSPRVYVGGNDGMLHGFNANTGVEEFAFVPTAVFAKLNKLTGKNYSHEFYVDGSPMVADAYNGSEWRTILVGTLRAGGKGLFALDITTPGSEKLLWEFDDASIPLPSTVKMGHSFAQPTIARLHTGKWAVVFGNGYEATNSANGKAALFIVDAFNGSLLKSLEVAGLAGTSNGLSTPKLADYNGDGVADYAYAGDLQGNLWRFDLLKSGRDSSKPYTTEDDSSSAIDDFDAGYGASPLFKAVAANAAVRQPITSAPSLIRHPSGKGHLVVFGTGKYFEDGDKDGNKNIAQSVYGIWDTKTRGESTSAISITRSNLVTQTIETQVTGKNSKNESIIGRTISDNAIAWTDASGNISKYGWLLDLTVGGLDGEMVIENMVIFGRTVLFQTLVPNSDPCTDGASNWIYAINPFRGGRTAHHTFDYKDMGDPSKPKVLAAIKQDGEGGITLSQTPDGSYEISSSKGGLKIYLGPDSTGRQSWRQVEEL